MTSHSHPDHIKDDTVEYRYEPSWKAGTLICSKSKDSFKPRLSSLELEWPSRNTFEIWVHPKTLSTLNDKQLSTIKLTASSVEFRHQKIQPKQISKCLEHLASDRTVLWQTFRTLFSDSSFQITPEISRNADITSTLNALPEHDELSCLFQLNSIINCKHVSVLWLHLRWYWEWKGSRHQSYYLDAIGHPYELIRLINLKII